MHKKNCLKFTFIIAAILLLSFTTMFIIHFFKCIKGEKSCKDECHAVNNLHITDIHNDICTECYCVDSLIMARCDSKTEYTDRACSYFLLDITLIVVTAITLCVIGCLNCAYYREEKIVIVNGVPAADDTNQINNQDVQVGFPPPSATATCAMSVTSCQIDQTDKVLNC